MSGLALVALLALAIPASAQWVDVCEQITWSWDAGSQLLAFHHHWDDNCGVMAVSYAVEVAGAAITVRETSHALALAYCICPYDGDILVEGLDPGEYTVIWDHTLDHMGTVVEHVVCDPFPVTVPESAPAGDVHLASSTVAGCGIAVTAVPDDPAPIRSSRWAAIKGIFD
jgi:hypothetical protein